MTILLINGSANIEGFDYGKLNDSLHDVAKQTLISLGHHVLETFIKDGYDKHQEETKFLSANVIIYQFPIWWFGQPWPLKKYIDEVFFRSQLYNGSGRTRENQNPELYGTGGLLKNKKFMVNTTQAAPESVFNNKNTFFKGANMDDVLLPVYKQNEFMGVNEQLPSYHVYDVYFQDNIDEIIDKYKEHLTKIFSL